MTPKHALLAALAALLTLALVAAAWQVGLRQGRSTALPGTGPAAAVAATTVAATIDPSDWTVPQGEEATRRHLREGLKAGDVDPLTGRRILNYHDPMVPGRQFDAPGKSPFMDMMLVPRYAGAQGADSGSIVVSPRIQQNLGLRTAEVAEGTLAPLIDAVGSVVWNEREQVLLQARATGFVERLHVRATLDRVTAGAALAEILVPAWVAAQEEYLALARMQGPDLAPLREAARQRMRLAGMDEPSIAQVVASGTLQARFTLRAPIAGIVTELNLREGATVMAGMTMLRLQGTGSVWAEGQVPESQAARLRPGTGVTSTSPAAPGHVFEGRVQAMLPDVDPATRTIRARLELANPGGHLVPGMLVQMRFAPTGGPPVRWVPSDAVIHTGRRSVVMLAEDEGRFRPVDVVAGLEADGRTEIVRGLQVGQRVVLSGQFLIDSEASLRGLESRLNQGGGAAAPPPHATDARVEAIEGDSITLDHPPIAALKWPQMTMDFKLPPHAQRPSGLAAGDRVRIEFRLQDGELPQITRLQRLAPEASK